MNSNQRQVPIIEIVVEVDNDFKFTACKSSAPAVPLHLHSLAALVSARRVDVVIACLRPKMYKTTFSQIAFRVKTKDEHNELMEKLRSLSPIRCIEVYAQMGYSSAALQDLVSTFRFTRIAGQWMFNARALLNVHRVQDFDLLVGYRFHKEDFATDFLLSPISSVSLSSPTSFSSHPASDGSLESTISLIQKWRDQNSDFTFDRRCFSVDYNHNQLLNHFTDHVVNKREMTYERPYVSVAQQGLFNFQSSAYIQFIRESDGASLSVFYNKARKSPRPEEPIQVEFLHERRRSTNVVTTNPFARPLSVELFNELKRRIRGHGGCYSPIQCTYSFAKPKEDSTVANSKEDSTVANSKEDSTVANAKEQSTVIIPYVSTPFSCIKDASDQTDECAIAFATFQSAEEGEPLSMRSWLTQPCHLEFVDFYPANQDLALLVNQAFWRSAAVFAAAVTSQVVPSLPVLPLPSDVKNGFFSISIDGGWIPSADEVDELEKRAREIISSNVCFDTVVVNEDIAKEYGFETSVNLCKLEDFVCMTDGPTIASPSQISLFKLLPAAVHREAVHLAGVALPVGQKTSAYNWNVICENTAKKFVR